MPLWRSQQENVYHECMRCGNRMPLKKMVWQNGLLLCNVNDCVDNRIVGSRDYDVTRAVAVTRHELEPDPKLTTPVARKNDQTETLY